MRLSRYLLVEYNDSGYDEPRSKTISVMEAVNYVLKNCRHSLNGTQIRRDISGSNSSEVARFTDPAKGKPRVSRNTSNHYTLIIDNSPKWKRYPKRSKSIICSVRTGRFHVFPENKSRIGVCPSYDFWPSFESSDIWDLDGFNMSLVDLAEFTLKNKSHWDTSYKQVVKTLEMIDDAKKEDYEGFIKELSSDRDHGAVGSFMSDSSNEFLFSYIKDKSARLLPYVENLLDPNKNGFQIKFAGSKITGDKEVWTDGKAILVNHAQYEHFMNEINRLK